MSHALQFYIDGAWVDPVEAKTLDVIDPSTEEAFAQVSLGSAADVDRAVAAARAAFPRFSRTAPAERRDLLRRILETYDKRAEDLAQAVSREMGAPIAYARDAQVWVGRAHLAKMIEVLDSFAFQHRKGAGLIVKEAIGVVGLITPWNWPLNQITCKVGPALAAGCTMVLKPSEVAPLDAIIFAEILHEAGVPNGVFNLVNGDGPTIGAAMSAHPDIDMMSFTGSTRAGIQVAKAAADTVKRVSQELGGKSANILLPDVDLEVAVSKGVDGCFGNAGQSCNAPTRMFVPRALQDEAKIVARRAAEAYRVGPADAADTGLGPVVSQAQFDKIQTLIQSGIDEGATLVAGGPGRPADLNRGYYVRPTVFADVTPTMRIAREEIFGPVLAIMPYDSEDEAVTEANNTPFGLAAYVQGRDLAKARVVAGLMRAGRVHINYPDWDAGMPFGGYKQSGNGREYAEYGLEDFLETKGISGYEAA
ncbi:aldehyde dehydrogenase family protein [Lichenihabitans sp. Uapishka_5]|uniref:aldehyde dehydrogenase family protein n=1 Tax=Lichenihabitans sp. Uapishka_5 TaxID=3037302 RepID=UPI0029E7FB0E|nr:aldehyde dehydrogenase family protein [Lichenihabitans sp. Uapishka_5]MDX7952845.1 aldehyde dehydrogenase family protein [Lichenihabitans sp. Uapishka_5]